MTVTIIGTVTANPETRVELENLLGQQVAPTRAEAGCINYDFHVDAEDPCVFVFYENWRSQADLDRHFKKTAFETAVFPDRPTCRQTGPDPSPNNAELARHLPLAGVATSSSTSPHSIALLICSSSQVSTVACCVANSSLRYVARLL